MNNKEICFAFIEQLILELDKDDATERFSVDSEELSITAGLEKINGHEDSVYIQDRGYNLRAVRIYVHRTTAKNQNRVTMMDSHLVLGSAEYEEFRIKMTNLLNKVSTKTYDQSAEDVLHDVFPALIDKAMLGEADEG